MPENRKYFVNKTAHFITARTEEGLPLVPSHILNLIIWGILARARSQYDVRVCHFVFLANHFHMLIVVDNPEHVPAFVGYVKAETAHAVNKLLGRRRKTVWAEGYDSPALLTPEDVQRYIQYIYLNPATANLVDSIEHYPGVSSWQMFLEERASKKCEYLPRDFITPLPLPSLPVNEQKRLVAEYQNKSLPSSVFTLEPYAWLDCFQGVDEEDAAVFRERTMTAVREREKTLLVSRSKDNKRTLGATTLRRQSMLAEHTPKKFSRRMICLCSDKERRLAYIEHFKVLSDRGRKVFEKWKLGDLSACIPLGLFAPHVPTLAVAMPLTL